MDKSNNFRLIEILNLLMVGEAVPKWIWPDHAIVVEVVYKKLVDEIKKNLNLAAMKDGSNDPDKNFKDKASHYYTTSYKKAIRWLDDAKLNYDEGNYKHISYCLGITPQYLIYTFSALQYIFRESDSKHRKFEVISDDYIPTAKFIPGDLDTL